jgi:hypothetical protein
MDAGRRQLNLSEWDRPQLAAAQVVDSVQERRMPPAYASLLNSDLQLNDVERAELVTGLKATLASGGAGPAVSTLSPPASGSAVLLATLGTALVAVGFALGRWRGLTSLSAPGSSLR